ncbi:hypothetical protein POM88_042875 [Heracleum sosnowskyi]|uniref:Uncharacterized protein n=1 Tax=Heracleum sosnowskyi TaxID=360622 RepID=A0AAD8HHG7_9APIA|nr:hypothetical protein POM88_042875 [Heracleum sosnowskyi]
MALKIVKYWRSMPENVNVINWLFRSSVSSALKVVTIPDLIAHHGRTMKGGARRVKLLELLPLMGIVFGAVGMGIHTAYHQLVHSPAVKISKENRSSLWEVDRPDQIIHSGDKFVNKSFFRKFGQIHDERVFPGSSSSQRKPTYTTTSYISTATATSSDKLVN